MKALILGDLHGHHHRLRELVVHTNPDVIILTGDIPSSIDLPVLILSYIKGRRDEYIKQIYERFEERLTYRQIRTAKRILLQLAEFNIPVVMIHGNTETPRTIRWLELFCHRYPNLHWIADDAVMINKVVFVGHGFSSNVEGYNRKLTPGELNFAEDFRKLSFTIHKAKVEYPEYEDIILITHSPPYNTSIDYLAHKKSHAGSMSVRGVLDDGEVEKAICGHLHEAFGAEYDTNWWAVNAGAVVENIACTVELNSGSVVWYTNFINRITLNNLIYAGRNAIKYDARSD
ncbi:MAG: metallophosphoesterase [Candidatus Heimdallarchaeota archaeon]|nr:metallophosphoesterase [Candidatus Heimdallarchaeota archaeon]